MARAPRKVRAPVSEAISRAMLRSLAMRTFILALLASLRAALLSRAALVLENAALRQQLAVYLRTSERPRLRTGDRVFWIALRRLWPDWTRPLVIVKPQTVIGWHRKGFKLFWRRKSARRPIGRPRICGAHIAFIRRISGDHPEWGEDRIAEELVAKFGVDHSASTIRRYMVSRHRSPRGDQTWRTFVPNHSKEVWACDFLTQYTALFAVAYIFVVMEIGSRRIVHVNVTTNPTLAWVKQQIREATAEDRTPRFLVHDNDGIFGQYGRPVIVEQADGRRSYRCHLDRWLDEVVGSEGIPIPYGAPNASPHVERFVRTLREEALNHIIFLTTDHIRRVVAEYVRYYNRARPSQAIHGIPDPYPELRQPPPRSGKLVALPVLGGIQHDYRLVA
jgi:putative transposase